MKPVIRKVLCLLSLHEFRIIKEKYFNVHVCKHCRKVKIVY